MNSEEINLEKLELELQIFNMYPNVKDEDKFVKILDRASANLKLFLVANDVKDLQALKTIIKKLENQSINVDKILEICMIQRGTYQDENIYANEISEQL